MAECASILALRLTADVENAACRSELEAALGCRLPEPGRVAGTENPVVWLGPRDWLVLGDVQVLLDRLSTMSRVIASIAPLARFGINGDLLSSGTSVKPNHSEAARTLFSQVDVTVLGEGEDYFILLVEPQYAAYVSAYLDHQIRE